MGHDDPDRSGGLPPLCRASPGLLPGRNHRTRRISLYTPASPGGSRRPWARPGSCGAWAALPLPVRAVSSLRPAAIRLPARPGAASSDRSGSHFGLNCSPRRPISGSSGWIIPGLLANTLARQKFGPTLRPWPRPRRSQSPWPSSFSGSDMESRRFPPAAGRPGRGPWAFGSALFLLFLLILPGGPHSGPGRSRRGIRLMNRAARLRVTRACRNRRGYRDLTRGPISIGPGLLGVEAFSDHHVPRPDRAKRTAPIPVRRGGRADVPGSRSAARRHCGRERVGLVSGPHRRRPLRPPGPWTSGSCRSSPWGRRIGAGTIRAGRPGNPGLSAQRRRGSRRPGFWRRPSAGKGMPAGHDGRRARFPEAKDRRRAGLPLNWRKRPCRRRGARLRLFEQRAGRAPHQRPFVNVGGNWVNMGRRFRGPEAPAGISIPLRLCSPSARPRG